VGEAATEPGGGGQALIFLDATAMTTEMTRAAMLVLDGSPVCGRATRAWQEQPFITGLRHDVQHWLDTLSDSTCTSPQPPPHG